MSLNRQQVREVDRRAIEQYGMSGLVLMENAGRGVADALCDQRPSGMVVVCCGGGNNGGDGFVIARHLDLRNISVRVLLFTSRANLKGDAAANFRILEKCAMPLGVMATLGAATEIGELRSALAGACWIVDALLGTGATGNPRPPLDTAIDEINASGKPILAVDLPSGLDCDTGEPSNHTVRAKLTCTFVAAKMGFARPGAAKYTGEVSILDIGAPRRLIAEVGSDAAASNLEPRTK